MPSLTPTDAVQRVLENVGRVVGDAQLPAPVLQRKLDSLYRVLRRKLSAEFPSLYEKMTSPIVVAAGATTITKPADCESVRVVERQDGQLWYPLEVAPSLNRDQYGKISFYEMGAILQLAPDSAAPGTYRLIYIATPATTITTYDVPDGLEEILVEQASAFARQRHNELEFVAYHKGEAERIWNDNYMALWSRYGSHGRSGLNQTRL